MTTEELKWDAKLLDEAASKILGERPLVERRVSRSGKSCELFKQVIKLAHARHLGEIYEPIGNPEESKPTKLTSNGNVCAGCGTPRSNGSASVCRRCYLNKAKESFTERKDERTNFLDCTASLIEFWQDQHRTAVYQFKRGKSSRDVRHEIILVHYDPDPLEHEDDSL